MKKNGILNSEISKIFADLGHTDQIMIADVGLPIPEGIKKIDLAVELGKPKFSDVLSVILKEMEVEKYILANEIQDSNQEQLKNIKKYMNNIEVEWFSHNELKQQSKKVKAVIRTGEATPYSNIILQSGVIF
ncbi:MAG: D-ribose pyranase [Alkalibacterium gilvum]|uniref:D-ribose pyranase n=1 Tax=Alkalibacterium gilvum TaxID=1130080 RepID=A0A1H6SPM9_9LACT|nr:MULTISPECIES: D-ribose pyranase [Alkalibacterium]MDN6409727.1 D-ribose pyranase [Tetragenococcus halophilus]MDN6293521.1 D-ribose pyranase [Alkalibacterium sp.]MDN6295237.1 D-ribose pyranase [Alkalibacterium sp.]MDN6397664.1 D-ribose pyranase [Alkalibacterium sp.]MDN6729244.1 D-ribose pyranase [Alkalibacterium sp.]